MHFCLSAPKFTLLSITIWYSVGLVNPGSRSSTEGGRDSCSCLQCFLLPLCCGGQWVTSLPAQASLQVVFRRPSVTYHLVSVMGFPAGSILTSFARKPTGNFPTNFTGIIVGRFPARFFRHSNTRCFLCTSLDIWYLLELLCHPVSSSHILSNKWTLGE